MPRLAISSVRSEQSRAAPASVPVIDSEICESFKRTFNVALHAPSFGVVKAGEYLERFGSVGGFAGLKLGLGAIVNVDVVDSPFDASTWVAVTLPKLAETVSALGWPVWPELPELEPELEPPELEPPELLDVDAGFGHSLPMDEAPTISAHDFF